MILVKCPKCGSYKTLYKDKYWDKNKKIHMYVRQCEKCKVIFEI